ncbi:MAG TPA: hypothetical protein VGN63_14700 [Flavisolibacter sp.]|jgi:hypothetical protein|nr:hypothetical protein [Flavisolibacter sp.]
MKNIVLYFPDAVNLKAFVLVENLYALRVDLKAQQLKGTLSKKLFAKAVTRYGAILMCE